LPAGQDVPKLLPLALQVGGCRSALMIYGHGAVGVNLPWLLTTSYSTILHSSLARDKKRVLFFFFWRIFFSRTFFSVVEPSLEALGAAVHLGYPLRKELGVLNQPPGFSGLLGRLRVGLLTLSREAPSAAPPPKSAFARDNPRSPLLSPETVATSFQQQNLLNIKL
jgi:hypothetical protein